MTLEQNRNEEESVQAGDAEIPVLGLGTSPMRGETCASVVHEALEIGYRHIDTAQGYDNEEAVGEGIAHSHVPHDAIFITTKVRPQWLSDGRLQESLQESLSKLRVDQVDLALIHWPNPDIPIAETIGALCDARRRGLARHIGVSNFTIALLDEAVAAASEPLAAEQLEYHPFIDQTRILNRIRTHGLTIIAYCPLARGRVVGDPEIERIAESHGKTAAQVTLRWLIQQGDVSAIPKTSRPDRLRENFAVHHFVLSDDEMVQMSRHMSRGLRLVNEANWVQAWDQ